MRFRQKIQQYLAGDKIVFDSAYKISDDTLNVAYNVGLESGPIDQNVPTSPGHYRTQFSLTRDMAVSFAETRIEAGLRHEIEVQWAIKENEQALGIQNPKPLTFVPPMIKAPWPKIDPGIFETSAPKCQCGAHKVNSKLHSSWCPEYKG